MSTAVALAIGAVGGLGAVARFALDRWVSSRLGRRFPYGTLAVNLAGAFALGVLVGAAVAGDGYRIAATGFIGAFTTFSTWMLETERLGEEGVPMLAVVNVALSMLFGLAAVWLGRQLGAAL